ncbi:glycosyltransferase [Methanobrevibacter sp.]|uniref:glycosyltransferase n=1 Tax=Methanobrevibacter sp. TaxID=66852 RepID=UPI00389116D1
MRVFENRGLEVAEEKYISFLDADDLFNPTTFEILIKKSRIRNLKLLVFKVLFIMKNK